MCFWGTLKVPLHSQLLAWLIRKKKQHMGRLGTPKTHLAGREAHCHRLCCCKQPQQTLNWRRCGHKCLKQDRESAAEGPGRLHRSPSSISQCCQHITLGHRKFLPMDLRCKVLQTPTARGTFPLDETEWAQEAFSSMPGRCLSTLKMKKNTICHLW